MYKLIANSTSIVRLADGAFIPADPANSDYAAYLRWVEEGNEPVQPVDERYYTVEVDGAVVEKPLAESKALRKQELATIRWEKQSAGIVVNNHVFATDDQSKVNYVAATMQAQADPNYSVLWKAKDMDGNPAFVTLSGTDILNITNAGVEYIAACFVNEKAIADQIDAAKKVSTMLAIDLTAGWPTRNY